MSNQPPSWEELVEDHIIKYDHAGVVDRMAAWGRLVAEEAQRHVWDAVANHLPTDAELRAAVERRLEKV